MPYINIGFDGIKKENLTCIVRWLNERDFNWEITVNNIAFIQDTGAEQVLKARFDISNESIPGGSCITSSHRHPATHKMLEDLMQVRDEILRERNGQPFEDSTELIRHQREERTRQLMGEEE